MATDLGKDVTPRKRLDYRNKIILAPMVKVGVLPFRLLALEYGADIVYSEELIDWKLIKTERRVNDVLGTVDFIDPTDGCVIFRTNDKERNRVVLQLGTASPERALMVAKKVQNDVAAIDINMGCPKSFSIKGGMGAALLKQPDKACAILKTLVDNCSIPITCKIRILDKLEDTLELVKKLEATGISALGVHGRMTHERPQHLVHPDVISVIANTVSIPVIANGGSTDILVYKDIEKFRKVSGASSVMIARTAQYNVSIFRMKGLLRMDEIIKAFLKLSVDSDLNATTTKYCVQGMLREQQESPMGKKFLAAQTLQQICEVWDLGNYCREKQLEFKNRGAQGRREVVPGRLLEELNSCPAAKRSRLDCIEENVSFIRSNFVDTEDLPKSLLNKHARKNGLPAPKFETEQLDKLFRSFVSYNGKTYTSSFWEKNKKSAEQAAALVCCLSLNLVSADTLNENGSILI